MHIKWLFSILCLWSFSLISYAQSYSGTAEIEKLVQEEKVVYKFQHEIDYFEPLEQRLLNYSNRHKIIISTINIGDYTCRVVFDEQATPEDISETLLFLANGLSFENYKLEE